MQSSSFLHFNSRHIMPKCQMCYNLYSLSSGYYFILIWMSAGSSLFSSTASHPDEANKQIKIFSYSLRSLFLSNRESIAMKMCSENQTSFNNFLWIKKKFRSSTKLFPGDTKANRLLKGNKFMSAFSVPAARGLELSKNSRTAWRCCKRVLEKLK